MAGGGACPRGKRVATDRHGATPERGRAGLLRRRPPGVRGRSPRHGRQGAGTGAARARGHRSDHTPDPRGPASAARDRGVAAALATGCGDRRRRARRRHPGQRNASRRVPARQPRDRRHGHRGRAPRGRGEAGVPRVELHLPARRATAGSRLGVADGTARADESVVRGGEDRRRKALPGLPAPVRLQFRLRHAVQPVRAGRPFRSRWQPRHPRADAPPARSEEERRTGGRRVGQRDAAARVPARGRPGRCDADGARTPCRRGAGQRGQRGRGDHRGTGPVAEGHHGVLGAPHL